MCSSRIQIQTSLLDQKPQNHPWDGCESYIIMQMLCCLLSEDKVNLHFHLIHHISFCNIGKNESTTWTPGENGLLWTRSTRSLSSKLGTLRELKTPLRASLKDALLELHPCFCRTTKFSCQQWNTAMTSKVYQNFLGCRVTKNKVERSKSTWHGFHATKYLWDCRENPKITP